MQAQMVVFLVDEIRTWLVHMISNLNTIIFKNFLICGNNTKDTKCTSKQNLNKSLHKLQ